MRPWQAQVPIKNDPWANEKQRFEKGSGKIKPFARSTRRSTMALGVAQNPVLVSIANEISQQHEGPNQISRHREEVHVPTARIFLRAGWNDHRGRPVAGTRTWVCIFVSLVARRGLRFRSTI